MDLFRTPNNSLGSFEIVKENRTYTEQVYEYNSDGVRIVPDINYRSIVYKDNSNDTYYTRITYGWDSKWFIGDKILEHDGNITEAYLDSAFDTINFMPNVTSEYFNY
jgi:hypothetical protein